MASEQERPVNGHRRTPNQQEITAANLLYPSRSLDFLEPLKKTSATEEGASRRAADETYCRFSDRPHARDQEHRTTEVPLNIAIVGGGLGGLSTAVALKLTGHTVTVYEAAPSLGEVGAGIQVPPNALRLLLRFGLASFIADSAVEPEAIHLRRWQDGSLIGKTSLRPQFRERYGAPYYVVHRAALLDALHKLALHHGIEVHVNSRVVSYDASIPSMKLASGQKVEADLIVAADGIHSLARSTVLSSMNLPDQTPSLSPNAAYRATVPVASMHDDPLLSPLLDTRGQNLWLGPSRHIMSYAIESAQSGRLFNMVLSHPVDTPPHLWPKDPSQEDLLSDMKAQFSGWDPVLQRLLSKVVHTTRWPLLTSDALPTWIHTSHKLLILGDAAHALLPYMSQGFAMAVEDGAALAHALSFPSLASRDDIPRALIIWQTVRKKRAEAMSQASWAQGLIWHLPDGKAQRARDRSMAKDLESSERPEGKEVLDEVVPSANQWSEPVTQGWTYAYDAEGEVDRLWDEDA